MAAPTDSNGNFHHPENGKFTAFEDYVKMLFAEREKQMERVFAERETSAEFKRIALKEALDEAKATTDKALAEAKSNVEQKLADAKDAADEVNSGLQKEIDTLKSGGAPFANRLDEEQKRLKADVDTLNQDAVRTKVLDALREQQATEARAQKKQIRAALITGAIGLTLAGINAIFQWAH